MRTYASLGWVASTLKMWTGVYSTSYSPSMSPAKKDTAWPRLHHGTSLDPKHGRRLEENMGMDICNGGHDTYREQSVEQAGPLPVIGVDANTKHHSIG
jgi:hypothetical protein